MALVPRSLDAVALIEAAYIAACAFAWSKEEQQAVALLRHLADSTPGLGPGFITRDPLCSLPLQGNSGYQALASRPEIQMQEWDKELARARL